MTLRIVRALAFVCAGLAIPALAEPAPPIAPGADQAALRMRGEISAIDPADRNITVKNDDGSRSFAVPTDTLLLTTAERESFDQLAVGDDVLVQAVVGDASQAQFIEVLEPDELTMELEDLPAIDVADTATVKGIDPLAATLRVSSEYGPKSYRITQVTRVHTPSAEVPLQKLTPGERVVVTARNRHGVLEALDVLVVAGPPASPSDTP